MSAVNPFIYERPSKWPGLGWLNITRAGWRVHSVVRLHKSLWTSRRDTWSTESSDLILVTLCSLSSLFVLWDLRHWQLLVIICVCCCLCWGFLNSWAEARAEISLFLRMSNPVCLDSCSIARLVSESEWSQAEHAGHNGVSGAPSLILYDPESNQLVKWGGIFSASQIWLICSVHDSCWNAEIL